MAADAAAHWQLCDDAASLLVGAGAADSDAAALTVARLESTMQAMHARLVVSVGWGWGSVFFKAVVLIRSWWRVACVAGASAHSERSRTLLHMGNRADCNVALPSGSIALHD